MCVVVDRHIGIYTLILFIGYTYKRLYVNTFARKWEKDTF